MKGPSLAWKRASRTASTSTIRGDVTNNSVEVPCLIQITIKHISVSGLNFEPYDYIFELS